MAMKFRTDLLYLEDITISMERITQYTEGFSLTSFKKDSKTVDAVIRNFEIIGEAAKKLSEELKNQNPDVPWKEMYYLRNRVMHEYFGIDYEIIWDIATNYLPANKAIVDKIIKELASSRKKP
jgi:uncharacterized protein with HEPN domain